MVNMKMYGRIAVIFMLSIHCIFGFSGCSRIHKRPAKQRLLSTHYDFTKQHARISSSSLAPVYAPLAEQIVADFGLAEKNGVGIDLGGGNGTLVVELAKRTSGMHWILADIDPRHFSYTAHLAAAEGVGSRIGMITADANMLPFRGNYADIIVSRGSFQFWGDLFVPFAEINRVLKPGGIAYIGRGLPRNLPVETARDIRFGKNGSGGSNPKYDVDETAVSFEHTMKKLGIIRYTIHRPSPPGSEGINYGIWLEWHKQ